MADSVFTSFVAGEDILDANNTVITENVWSDGIGGTLTTFHTSSVQVSASGDYYYDIYQINPSGSGAAVQFSLAYGNIVGSGSWEKFSSMGYLGNTPSKAIYNQYKNLLLPKSDTQFTLYNGKSVTQFIAVSFARNRLKDTLDPGNWELSLTGTGNTQFYTDSNTGTLETTIAESYDIYSGSLDAGEYDSANRKYYGKAYPKQGVLIFDADMLKNSGSIAFDTSAGLAAHDHNNNIFYNALVAGDGFQARNKQTISSTFYFVRVKNSKYNYSTNPTYTTGSNGVLRFYDWINDPVTYITTIGLYDPDGNLVAVSKLSQPIKKTKNDEALIKVKLSF